MQRRNFLKSSVLVAGAFGLGKSTGLGAEKSEQGAREFYELRLYNLRRGPRQKLFDEFFRQAAIPAMNRHGLGPIGVFNIMIGPDNPTMYVLIPHKSLASYFTAHEQVHSDPEFRKAGADFIDAPPNDPAYVRLESSLMIAFPGMPKLEVPKAKIEGKSRIFELRTYESHSKRANLKKIEMFDIGETAIFRRTGLTPVFFGETLVGSKLPNLTYMLVFDNMAARDKNWGTFVADPEWKKLSATPGYTDPEIVSNISSVFLRPTGYSQI
jgi:hypothetical protein